jgi:hypothetical protein
MINLYYMYKDMYVCVCVNLSFSKRETFVLKIGFKDMYIENFESEIFTPIKYSLFSSKY